MPVIDIHAHWVPRTFSPPPPGASPQHWPVMIALDDGRQRMLIGGQEFRIFEPAYWDVAARLATMDREGIAVQVLSPLPELLGYWFDAATTEALADHMHLTIAQAIAAAPTRLAGMGMLPLQDIDAAVRVAARVARHGLRGVLVASNVNGVSIADPRFDPVFAALQRLDLAVLVHGYRPAGTERLLGSPLLAPIIGVPQDTAAALASFIMTDIFARFPDLRLGFAHGGGSFGAVLDRMNHVWHEFPTMQATLPVSPREYVRKFFFDTVTFGTDYLRYLIGAFGADTLMAGTDGPTPIGQTNLAAFITAACAGHGQAMEAISWRNAARFLSLHGLIAPHAARAA